MNDTLWCVVVAFLWGLTNPLMKQGSEGLNESNKSKSPSPSSKQKNQDNSGLLNKTYQDFKYLLFNYRYTVPFLVNQGGSLLYYWTLSTATLSVAVPLTNALTLVITVLTGRFLGEKSEGVLLYLGVSLVFIGIGITNY